MTYPGEIPVHYRANTETVHYSHSYPVDSTVYTRTHVCGLWEEARVPAEHANEERTQNLVVVLVRSF